MKKSVTVSILVLASIGMMSCGNTDASALSQPTESADMASTVPSVTESVSDSVSESTKRERHIELTLSKDTMSQGTDFLSSIQASVVFYSAKNSMDITGLATLSIRNSKGQIFEDYELLEPGTYTVEATYAGYSDSRKITVVSHDAPLAGEGDGYRLVDMTGEDFNHHPHLGALGSGVFPTKGNQRILVVPVTFSGLPDFTETERKVIDEAYFSEGNAEKGGFYSLKEYYEISSYQQLSISGTVAPTYVSSKTSSDFEKEFEDKGYDAVYELIDRVAEFVKTEEGGSYSLTDYDNNDDGYIDGIELIYKTDKADWAHGGKQVWWNYTSKVSANEGKGSAEDPLPMYFFFSSYSQLANGYYQDADGNPLPDTHTIIHEMGHMLGANDYYSYDRDSSNMSIEGPLGGSDMMDFNVGDHNPYTKTVFGWTNPYVIDGSKDHFTVNLPSFADTGRYLILRNTRKELLGNPYDEYLTLEYYTPTGVNTIDSQGYEEWKTSYNMYGHAGMFEKPGLRVLHVDSRLVQGYYKEGSEDISYFHYTDENVPTAGEAEEEGWMHTESHIGSSNTSSYQYMTQEDLALYPRSKLKQKYLLSMISSDGVNHYNRSDFTYSMGDSNCLFGVDYAQSEAFSMPAMDEYFILNNYRFNDGSSLEYDFQVIGRTDDAIQIRFDKIA